MNQDVFAEVPDEVEDSDTRKLRVAFCAELLHEVLRVGGARPWKEWAIIAEHHYQANRQRYLDGDVSAILTSSKKGDWWLRSSYINNPKTRSLIRTYLAENGIYIASIVGRGVMLASTDSEIVKDYTRGARAIKGRGDKHSYRGNAINETRGMELPMIAVNALLPRGN